MRRLPKRLTQDEVDKLVGAPSLTCPTGRRNHALLRLMVYGGLRCDEVLRLRTADVGDGEVTVRGKGDKERVVPFDRSTELALRQWIAEKPRNSNGRVFVTLQGKPLNSRYVRELVEREAEKVDLPRRQRTKPTKANPDGQWSRAWPHLLRHTAASMSLEGTLPGQQRPMTIEQVRDWLGHSELQTTGIYLHATPVGIREALRGGDGAQDLRARIAAMTSEQKDALLADMLAKLTEAGR